MLNIGTEICELRCRFCSSHIMEFLRRSSSSLMLMLVPEFFMQLLLSRVLFHTHLHSGIIPNQPH